MAKKKSKAQRKEEQRRAMERKRRETGWQPPPEPDMEQERLLADMAPLLKGAQEGAVSEQVAMVPFMELILGSEHLIEEPEFDGVYAHPLLCVRAFSQAMEELDLDGVEPGDLSAPEQEEAHAALMELTTMMALTGNLQDTVLAALGNLRERAREGGDQDLMAHAAAVYAFLDGVAVAEVWPNVGVVQAVVHRSLSAGIEMYGVVEEQAEMAAAGKARPGLLRRIIGATPQREMDRVLARYPGLAGFMEEHVYNKWEEGVEAVSSGELDLEFFSDAELSAASEVARSLGIRLTEGGGLLIADADAQQETVEAFAARLSSYVDELATAERLEAMQAQLEEILEGPDIERATFLMLLNQEFDQAETSNQLRPLLVRALVGEMQNAVRAGKGAEE